MTMKTFEQELIEAEMAALRVRYGLPAPAALLDAASLDAVIEQNALAIRYGPDAALRMMTAERVVDLAAVRGIKSTLPERQP